MPALVLFGHKTAAAGDDLQPLSFLYIILRLAQIGIVITLFKLAMEERDMIANGMIFCEEDGNDAYLVKMDPYFEGAVALSWIYTLGMLVLTLCYLFTDVSVWKISSRGTPAQPEMRRALPPLCSTKIIIMGTARLILFIIGIAFAARIEYYCSCRLLIVPDKNLRFQGCSEQNRLVSLYSVLLISQLSEILAPVAAAAFTLWREWHGKVARHTERVGYTREHRWQLCCACCCNLCSLSTCCLCGGSEVNRGGYTDVARALATFFDDGGILDIVTTDVILGLVMLLRVQEQRKIECQRSLIHDAAAGEKSNDDSSTKEPSRRLDMAHRMSKAAINESMVGNGYGGDQSEGIVYQIHREGSTISYTAKLRRNLMSRNKEDALVLAEARHFCRLSLGIYGYMMYILTKPATGCCRLGYMRCKSSRACSCCPGYTESGVVGDISGLNEVALLAQADISRGQLRYASFAEGFSQSPYCITIDDEWKCVVVTIRGTLSLDDAVVDLTISPVQLDEWAERCAFDGAKDYAHNGMLHISEWLYSDLKRHGILDKLLLGEDAEFPNYQLRVVGHSLGAGVAAVLATMLRSEFPTLHCHSFEPPGCVFSRQLAEACKPYVTSIVFGDDVVPRLSLTSMENLRKEALHLIARLKVPKHVALRPLWKKDVIEANEEMLHRTSDVPKSQFLQRVREFEEFQDQKKMESATPNVELFPPGKIIHLFRISKGKCCSRGFPKGPDGFVARYTEVDDFREIICSSKLLSDHQPDVVCAGIEWLADSFGVQDGAPPSEEAQDILSNEEEPDQVDAESLYEGKVVVSTK